MRDIEGKVAFITGGDSGIGLGIARVLVNAGMKVVITYRTRTHLDEAMASLEHAHGRVHAIGLDVTDRMSMDAAAQETARVFGGVHVLINNAGVGLLTPLSNATFDDWDWCMSVNVGGVFNGIRAFLPLMLQQDEYGHIVATASMLGGLMVGPYWGVYSTSKFAVVGMMEALRSELAHTKIGVSVFCPAGVTSGIGNSLRNRPGQLSEAGEPDARTAALIDAFNTNVLDAMRSGTIEIDPLEAGEYVLQGIRNNDLYILTHPEYEQALRDRSEAILAAIPRPASDLPEARTLLGQIVRNNIYAHHSLGSEEVRFPPRFQRG